MIGMQSVGALGLPQTDYVREGVVWPLLGQHAPDIADAARVRK